MEQLGLHKHLEPSNINDVLFNKWAVGERGVPEYIAVGHDGVIFTSNNPTVLGIVKQDLQQLNLEAVAYDGTTYVVVGEDGTILTSQNGNTWVTILLVE